LAEQAPARLHQDFIYGMVVSDTIFLSNGLSGESQLMDSSLLEVLLI